MPTITWETLKREIGRRAGGHFAVQTISPHITASAITSADLIARFPNDSRLKGWYVMVEDAASSENGKIRRITAYTAATGAMAITDPDLTPDTNERTVSIYRRHPDDLRDAYNSGARLQLFPSLGMVRDVETLVTGQIQHTFTLPTTFRRRPLRVWLGTRQNAESIAENVLSNAGFENFTSGAADSWTLVGAGATQAQESQTSGPKNYAVLEGSSSVKLSIADSTATTFLQTVTPSVGVEGMEVNKSIWVYCNTASRVSAQISGSDVVSTPVTGTKHGGTGWERLTVNAFIDVNGTSFDTGVDITSGVVIALYVDEAICLVGQSEPADSPWEPLLNWRWRPSAAGASDGGILEVPYRLPVQHRLRIQGMDLLSSVSADTDTLEVGDDFIPIIAEKCWAYLLRQDARQTRDRRERASLLEEASLVDVLVDNMLAEMPLQAPMSVPQVPDWSPRQGSISNRRLGSVT